jgi:hypothetical protein
MMGIEPSERILLGRWSREGERVIADEVSARIHSLIKSHLVELGKDTSGWNTLYRDPDDGRYWELAYPKSELQGGGPPQLKCLTTDEVMEKYAAHLNRP